MSNYWLAYGQCKNGNTNIYLITALSQFLITSHVSTFLVPYSTHQNTICCNQNHATTTLKTITIRNINQCSLHRSLHQTAKLTGSNYFPDIRTPLSTFIFDSLLPCLRNEPEVVYGTITAFSSAFCSETSVL